MNPTLALFSFIGDFCLYPPPYRNAAKHRQDLKWPQRIGLLIFPLIGIRFNPLSVGKGSFGLYPAFLSLEDVPFVGNFNLFLPELPTKFCYDGL